MKVVDEIQSFANFLHLWTCQGLKISAVPKKKKKKKRLFLEKVHEVCYASFTFFFQPTWIIYCPFICHQTFGKRITVMEPKCSQSSTVCFLWFFGPHGTLSDPYWTTPVERVLN